MHLLHVDASPRSHSYSRLVTHDLIATLAEADPTLTTTRRDLSSQPVPHITESWTEICDNLMREGITDLAHLHRGAQTAAQRQAWEVVSPLLDEVVAADAIVISTPMYNYSVPSSLKAWIDQITFPRMQLGSRRFVVIASRGGSYAPGSPKESVEHQTRYLADFFVGHFSVAAPDVITVDLVNSTVDPLLVDLRDKHDASLEEARAAARALAGSLSPEVAP